VSTCGCASLSSPAQPEGDVSATLDDSTQQHRHPPGLLPAVCLVPACFASRRAGTSSPSPLAFEIAGGESQKKKPKRKRALNSCKYKKNPEYCACVSTWKLSISRMQGIQVEIRQPEVFSRDGWHLASRLVWEVG